MDISVIWSVYDRRDYVLRALDYLQKQTLHRSRWEVVIVDDDSPGNYLKDLEPWRGKINIQYAKIDAFQHPVIQGLNPEGRPLIAPFDEPLRFHTPALTHNIAFRLARGKILFITQPDILHKETNLEFAAQACKKQKQFLFGRVWLSNHTFRENVLRSPVNGIHKIKYANYLQSPGAQARTFRQRETYWYVSAIQKEAAYAINGVDEMYLQGVFAEDDHFRVRCQMAGYPTEYTEEMSGIHIDHTQLNGRHNRREERWKWGANRNRSMWQHWNKDPNRKAIADNPWMWGDPQYVTEHEVWDL